MSLILASSSPFRKALLNKLCLNFDSVSPDVDESRRAGETCEQLVLRLAQAKAQEVAKTHTGVIIGSDQVAMLGDRVLTKPNNHQNATEQLIQSSGKSLIFVTSLAILNTDKNTLDTHIEKTKVVFKSLSRDQIENYLQREKPYDCAGSFKSEAFGISLLERIEGDDPNALIGLPLIQLTKMLAKQGIDVLAKNIYSKN